MAFAGISGVNDGGNLIGTYLSTGTVKAIVMIPLLILSIGAGPFLFGTAVSHTIAVEVVNFQLAGLPILALALAASLGTLGVTWFMKIPTSTTMALAGGMMGATLASGHLEWIHWAGVLKIFLGLLGSVIGGFVVAFVVTRGLWAGLKRWPKWGLGRAGRVQYLTVLLQGLAYGANDQEKAIGLMAIFLVMARGQGSYHVGFEAILWPWLFWIAGLFAGGLRIARTVGGHVFRLKEMHAISTQTSAAITVVGAALVGLPVSTTQTTDGSLFGMGTAISPYKVKWKTVRKFLVVWASTFPLALAAGLASMEIYRLFT